jgi:hypothetical protein
MAHKRPLPWNNPSARVDERQKRPYSSQSSSRPSSSQPSSSWSSSNSRSMPIIINDSDDELYEEIFSQPLLPEIDNFLSIGYMGTIH